MKIIKRGSSVYVPAKEINLMPPILLDSPKKSVNIYVMLLEILRYYNRRFTFSKTESLMKTDYSMFPEFVFVNKRTLQLKDTLLTRSC